MSHNLTSPPSVLMRFLQKMTAARYIDQMQVPFLLFLYILVIQNNWGKKKHFCACLLICGQCIIMPSGFLKASCAKALILKNIFKYVAQFFVKYFSLNTIVSTVFVICQASYHQLMSLSYPGIIMLISRSVACSRGILYKLKLIS